MLKNAYILPARRSARRIFSHAKIALATNLSLGLIILPVGSISAQITPSEPNTQGLIIPQDKLDVAFNVTPENQNNVQIPLSFLYISQGFSRFHPAIDFAAKYGTSIKTIAKGKVKEAGFSPFGYGNHVVIEHQNGLESLYAHLSKILVKVGDEVTTNTVIGSVGITGHATGPHLHLETRIEGKSVNPLTILPPLGLNSNLISSL